MPVTMHYNYVSELSFPDAAWPAGHIHYCLTHKTYLAVAVCEPRIIVMYLTRAARCSSQAVDRPLFQLCCCTTR